MPILYSYTPEEVEKFKAKLKQAEVICTPNTGHPVLGVF